MLFRSDAGYKLDVNGTFRATGAATFSSSVTATNFTGAYLDYKPGGVETFIVGKASYNVFDGNQLAIGSFTSIPIEFATANTKRMIITAAGNVGIGTTSPLNYGAGFTGLTLNGSTLSFLTAQANGVSKITISAINIFL